MSSRDISGHEKDIIEIYDTNEKDVGNLDLSKQASLPELKKAASHALSNVASRFTTRDIIDPGPPPDGGFKAWLQVFMAWVVCFTTW